MFGKKVAYFGNGAVLVVGGHFNHDGNAAGAVAFIEGFGEIAASVFAGALADGALNLVLGQVHRLGCRDGRAQTGVADRVTAGLGGDDDFLGSLGEYLAALGVLTPLAVLNIGPFAMTRHKTSETFRE